MEQINITIPYTFIASKVRLTWQEVLFGIEEGIFSSHEAIDVASELLSQGDDSDAILDLASRTQDESIMDAVVSLAQAEAPQNIVEVRRLWAFLILVWVLEHRNQYENPLDIAEKVYADLDYPEQVDPLISYMPANEPDLGSLSANETHLFEKWTKYIESEGKYFLSRNTVVSKQE
jgi:hypothetical protein